ncbi:hypothetical protein B9Z19DRAFT_1069216 [Tuber borchii]|uniref:Uncharacterized protein n=1 Tax=Tuber borchii TaxID=42251 RepID=A0A2T6ZCE1_TUBBO|nr:hypothetical protein B9Z19DRAFT_1069216 [Tuber borchii]
MTTFPSSKGGSSHAQQSEPSNTGAGLASFTSIQVKPSIKFTGFTGEIQKHGPVLPVQNHLRGLTKAEMALAVVEMLNLHQQHSEVLGVVVTHIWEYYIVPGKLWEHYEGGKSQFMEDVAFSEFVGPTIKSSKATQSRKLRNIASLQAAWGVRWLN